MRRPIVFLPILVTIAACGQAASLPTATPTPEPSLTPSSTYTPSPIPTATETRTPRPTSTRPPTNTPTMTLEPRSATRTSEAIAREATRAFNQMIDDTRANCPPIDWVELSEVQYAQDHEGECVYIRGRTWDVNFEEELLELSIGFYAAEIAVGVGMLSNTSGRITEDMWLDVYGFVCTSCWVSTNNFTGDQTPLPGIDAMLIEGPHGLLWVAEQPVR